MINLAMNRGCETPRLYVRDGLKKKKRTLLCAPTAALLPLLLLDTPENSIESDRIRRKRMLHEKPDDYKSLQIAGTKKKIVRCIKNRRSLSKN